MRLSLYLRDRINDPLSTALAGGLDYGSIRIFAFVWLHGQTSLTGAKSNELNPLAHYRAQVDGGQCSFSCPSGNGPAHCPIVLTHDSKFFVGILLVAILTYHFPRRFREGRFDVVTPPTGHGFSDPRPNRYSKTYRRSLCRLMRDGLDTHALALMAVIPAQVCVQRSSVS